MVLVIVGIGGGGNLDDRGSRGGVVGGGVRRSESRTLRFCRALIMITTRLILESSVNDCDIVVGEEDTVSESRKKPKSGDVLAISVGRFPRVSHLSRLSFLSVSLSLPLSPPYLDDITYLSFTGIFLL